MSEKVTSQVLPVLGVFPTRSELLVLKAEAMFNQGGEERVSAEDRRIALAYLMVVRADMSNYELGSLFKVSEGLIRKDKEIVRKQMADEAPTDDITVFLSDLRRYYETCRTALARSTKKCTEGTAVMLAHIKAAWDLEKEYLEAMQGLGVLPKNLGNLTKTEYIFKAHVSKGGGVNTTVVKDNKDLKTIEAREVKYLEAAHETPEDAAIRAQFDEEFSRNGG